jgi:hypothetical protein
VSKRALRRGYLLGMRLYQWVLRVRRALGHALSAA